MPWTAVAGSVAGAVATSALSDSGGSSAAAGAADPFSSQRGQYQQMLQEMMTGGGFTPSDPSYQFRLNQGLGAVNANAAASGMLRSGNRMMALEDYAQNFASTEYSNQFNRLAQLAGANVGSPAAAGQIQYQAGQAGQAGASAIGNSVGKAVSSSWGNSLSSPTIYGTGDTSQTVGNGFTLSGSWS